MDGFPPETDLSFVRLRQRLLWRIRRRYQTVTERRSIGGLELSFTRIADPDLVLEEVAAEEDRRDLKVGARRDAQQLHLPYWAELWDSASGVGQFLVAAHQSPPRPLSGGG